AAEWSLFGLAILLAAARFSLHLRMGNRNLLLPDLWLLVTVLCCLGLIICDTITYHAGAMSDFTTTSSLIRQVHVEQVRFATNYFFDFGLYFPKFSMLAFYVQIIPKTLPKLRKGLYGVITFVACSSLTTLFADTFWCGTDVSINWWVSTEAETCSVFSAMPLVKMNWSLNFISEALILLLPFPMLRGLNLRHRSEKIGLFVVFLLGGITLLVSTARFIGQLIVANNIAIYILAMTEFTVSIMILSLVSLRPLLRKVYRAATGSSDNSPFSRSNDTKSGKNRKSLVPPSGSRWKGSRAIHSEKPPARNIYGSEVELTELEAGKIYKTEEISISSARGVDSTEEGKSSQEGGSATLRDPIR
ncbi:hypothetical protein GQ44DRAFT_636759, partial [Phaeosphaeriaceae sp. PMI808]